MWGSAEAQVATHYTRAEALRLAFPQGEAYRPVDLALSPEVKSAVENGARVKLDPSVMECFQGRSGTSITAYACIDNMIGRESYITYIIRIGHPKGEIEIFEVMQYREAVGSVVHYPFFTKHFLGKTARSHVRTTIDIPLISGATLSVHALADGLRKMLHVYHHFLRHLEPMR